VPYLHKDFSVTMVNQDVVTTPGELKAISSKQFNAPDRAQGLKVEPRPIF